MIISVYSLSYKGGSALADLLYLNVSDHLFWQTWPYNSVIMVVARSILVQYKYYLTLLYYAYSIAKADCY